MATEQMFRADQVINDLILAPASIHDTNALDALLEDREGLKVCGDKAYNDQELEERLWLKRQILLMPLRRDNMSNRWSKGVQRLLGKARHLIETVFSTLSTTYNIQRPRRPHARRACHSNYDLHSCSYALFGGQFELRKPMDGVRLYRTGKINVHSKGVGIDISKEKFDVAIYCTENYQEATFTNDKKGFRSLVSWLEKMKARDAYICMEATGRYADAVVMHLYERGLSVSIINPA